MSVRERRVVEVEYLDEGGEVFGVHVDRVRATVRGAGLPVASKIGRDDSVFFREWLELLAPRLMVGGCAVQHADRMPGAVLLVVGFDSVDFDPWRGSIDLTPSRKSGARST